jgi:hypothetical protein
MSHAIGDDQERTHRVTTNLLLTMLHKICAKTKLNDRHLIGRPSAEKVRMIDSLKKARHSKTIVHSRMLRTHVIDALHMTGSSTFFSSNQHQDWYATHCLRVIGISSPSAAHQIKKYRQQNEFSPGVTAKCYTWLAVGGTHYQWLQIGNGCLYCHCKGKREHTRHC